jgi:16S rRNA (uracil1498-N3)-methyltransferase
LTLPATAARHVQVLRLQPGDTITLFNGSLVANGAAGGEFQATVLRMSRSDVDVLVGPHQTRECEPALAVHLAVGMPANERMDWLVEKATELGAASIQPLMTARTVLRLTAERAAKKQQHWQAIAAAACEQCGRNRVPVIHPVRDFAPWLAGAESASHATHYVLSLAENAMALPQRARELATPSQPCRVLIGPEGGLDAAEERAALAAGWLGVSLGPRVLRAETAALAALVTLTLAA